MNSVVLKGLLEMLVARTNCGNHASVPSTLALSVEGSRTILHETSEEDRIAEIGIIHFAIYSKVVQRNPANQRLIT